MIVKQRLLLEYNRSSQTSFVVEWEYVEAEAFGCETYWYIDAIASIHWFSVHGSFCTVNSVGGFTNSHNDLGVAVEVDGYSAVILVPDNFSVKGFSQCADRNHGSPVAVDVWSSIASDDLVVDNVFGRIDGHNNSAVSECIFSTEGVFEGAIVCFSTSLNNDNDVSGGFLISINSQAAFASVNLVVHFNRNLSIFIALVSNPSGHVTFYLLSLAVSVNNSDVDFVVLADSAVVGAEFKRLVGVRISNSQGLFNELLVGSVERNNLNGGADQGFICWNVNSSTESIVPVSYIDNRLTDEVVAYASSRNLDAIAINILSIYNYSLAKSDGVINIHPTFVRVSWRLIIIGSLDIKNGILNLTKLHSIEGNGSVVFAVSQGNAYFVLTFGEIFIITISSARFISKGVSASSAIPYECEVAFIEMRVFWFFSDFKLIARNNAAHSFSFGVSDFKLNRIREVYSLTLINSSAILAISTGEDVAASQGSIDTFSSSLSSSDLNGVGDVVIFINQGHSSIALALHHESDVEVAILIGYISSSIVFQFNNRIFVGGSGDLLTDDSIAIFINEFTGNGDRVDTIICKIGIGQIEFANIAGIESNIFGATIVDSSFYIFKFSSCCNFVTYSDSRSTLKLIIHSLCKVFPNACMQGVCTSLSKSYDRLSIFAGICNRISIIVNIFSAAITKNKEVTQFITFCSPDPYFIKGIRSSVMICIIYNKASGKFFVYINCIINSCGIFNNAIDRIFYISSFCNVNSFCSFDIGEISLTAISI